MKKMRAETLAELVQISVMLQLNENPVPFTEIARYQYGWTI